VSETTVGIAIFVVYTLLAWVRKIEKFSFAFILGSLLIVASVLIISAYCIGEVVTRVEPVQGFIPMNYYTYMDMVGFSVYNFEGIGVVMPLC